MVQTATPPTSEASPSSRRHLEATLNLQRKAALAAGGALDHAGRVQVRHVPDFDMGRTIFGGMQGTLPRMVMKDKIAREIFWSDKAVAEVEAAYAASEAEAPVPVPDQRLVDFMIDECDFSMEHADGTFLEHLVFCHDYAVKYYPEHSPNIALLHSILGTATNTFAMKVDKLPKLKDLLTEKEALHVEAFPSLLRLFYDGKLLPELQANLHRLDQLESIHFHRVIDNAGLSMSGEDLWVDLNFHLMHFVDFMPAANWATHASDPLLLQFRELSELLDAAGERQAKVEVSFPEAHKAKPVGESVTMAGRISAAIPMKVKKQLARKSIREYSAKAGHSLDYTLKWRA
ncbi:MAG: hypothetical protein AAFU79_01490 [Myxococcota bacterium]